MTQEALANYLCVTRASLSVELHKMQKEGLIQYKGQTYTLLAFNESSSDTR
jgi:CRP-like cAMP-binding protein